MWLHPGITLYSKCQSGHCDMCPVLGNVFVARKERVVSRINTSHSEPACITEHESFHPVALNIFWVLQTAHFKYRQTYGRAKLIPSNINKYFFKQKLSWQFLCRQCRLEMLRMYPLLPTHYFCAFIMLTCQHVHPHWQYSTKTSNSY